MARLPTKIPGDQYFGEDYGDIYGPVGEGQPEQPDIVPKEPEVEPEIRYRTPISFPTLKMPTLNEEDYQPTTREVSPDELVENRLTQLLKSDSPYMQQARRAGERAAAERGALSSSIFAGASQAAATQAALPIAQQDAQTYYRTAAENMAAKNNMTLAKLQSATSILQTHISAGASLASSRIQAQTQLALKEMDVDMRKELFQLGADHDSFMENLRQEGRIELSELGYYQQRQLEEMGFDHAVELSELTHQQRIELEETFSNPRFYANLGLQRQNIISNIMMQMSGLYMNGITSMNMADIDEQAFQRGETFYSQMFEFMLGMNNNLWNNSFPDINIGGSSDGPTNTGPQPGGG